MESKADNRRSVKPIDCTQLSTRPWFFQVCRVFHLFVVKRRRAHFFFLNTVWMLSFTSNLAIILLHRPRPPEKLPEKFLLNLLLIFYCGHFFEFLAKCINWHVLQLKFLHPVFSVFFNMNVFSFNVLP